MKMYCVNKYAMTTWNEPTQETSCTVYDGNSDECCQELNTDKHYHLRIHSDKPCLVFGDFDKCPSDDIYQSFLESLTKFFKVSKDEISYTLSLKPGNIFSYHWSIPSIESNCKSLKLFLKSGEFAMFNEFIDLTVYNNKFFRLPNQTNIDRPLIHKVVQGKMKHFLFHKVKKGLNKMVIEDEEPSTDVEFIDEEDGTEKLEPSKTTKIRDMVVKMKGYFDGYDNWSQLGMIIHHEFHGSSEGLDLFDDLSKLFKNYKDKFNVSKFYMALKPNHSKKKITIASLCKWYYEIFPDEKATGVYAHPVYIKEKAKLEIQVFKLNNPISFVIFDGDNDMQIVDMYKLKVWSKGKFKKIEVKADENTTEFAFIDVWLDDPYAKQFDKLVFDPKMRTDNNNFNMFKGFNYKAGEAVNESESKFLKLLKYLCDDDAIYEYMLCWISNIFKRPWQKSNVAVVFFSKNHGIGKNAIIDGLCTLLGIYSGHIESIDDITKSFNNHIVNKLLTYGDEINANAKKVSDKLKQVITRSTMNLEKKGVDAIEVANYSNWIFSTNNENCFKIEEDDRRLLMVRCPNNALPIQVYKDFYNEIQNTDEMSKLFNFFMKYTNDKYDIGVDRVIMTKYKKQLSFENMPAYIEMFYKQPFEFTERVYTSTELFIKAKDYAKLVYSSSNFTVTTFGKAMKEMFGDYVKKSNGTMKYMFKTLTLNKMNEHLLKYNDSYYRYVHNYDDDDVIVFRDDNTTKYDTTHY